MPSDGPGGLVSRTVAARRAVLAGLVALAGLQLAAPGRAVGQGAGLLSAAIEPAGAPGPGAAQPLRAPTAESPAFGLQAGWSAASLSDPASIGAPMAARPSGSTTRRSSAGPRQSGGSPASPGRAALYSVVLPGAGQHALGQRRKWLYLALEATGWFFYVDRRSAGGDLAVAYRDFAWDEARLQGASRVDGDFDYYERLSKWQRSGAFDADPGAGGIQPETDPATWNGSVWALAERLFLPGGPSTPPSDPQYQRALEYYASRGYGDGFLWDWTGTGGAQDEYADLIAASDERYRQATNVLGAIIANHVVSAVDAFLSARGLASPARLRVAPGVVPGAEPNRWHVDVRLPVGP